MVIKKLKREIDFLEEEIKNGVMSREDREKKVVILNTYKKFWEFISEGKYLKRKGQDKLRVYLAEGDEGLAKHFLLTRKQVIRVVYHLNSTVEKYITDGMLKNVAEGKIRGALAQFNSRIVSLDFDEEFMTEAKSVVADCKADKVELGLLNDCAKELKFLRDYSLNTLYMRIGELDMDKIEAIVGIMKNGNSEYNKQRGIIYQYLIEGKGDEQGAVAMFNKIFNCEI